MTHISFSQFTSKRHVMDKENSISLPMGKGVLLQGDKDVVTSIFTHILYQKQCQFTSEDELLDKGLLNDNIVMLTSDGALPLTKKVKSLFTALGYDQGQSENILRGVDLASKVNWHIFRLSKEERILLSVQLACVSQASVLLLDKDWTKLSISCQNKITNLLEKHLKNGNFLLVNQGAMHLILCDEQYEVVGQNIQSKQEHIANFLEEKGTIDYISTKKQTTWKRFKNKLACLFVFGNAVYCMFSVLLVSLALIVVFGFSLAIQQLDTNITREKEREQFHLDIKVCSREYRPEEFCDDTSLSSEQLDMLNTIDEIDRVYPTHTIRTAAKGWLEFEEINTVGIYADDELITQADESSMLQAHIKAFDASLFHIEETFTNNDNTRVGIYISKNVMNDNKDLFDDILDKKLSIRGDFEIPIYSQTINTSEFSEFEGNTNRMDVMEIPIRAQFDLPILGVVEEEYSWYMDEQLFYKLQKEAIQKYSKDSTELYVTNINVPIEDYQVTHYQALVSSYDKLVIIEDKLKTLDPKIRIVNTVPYMQQNKQTYIESDVKLKEALMPILVPLLLLMVVCSTVLYRFQKFKFLYEFQHQRINRQWKLRMLIKIILMCISICTLSFLLISVLSLYPVQERLMSIIMNSSFANSQNIYDNTTFLLLTMAFQVFPMYIKSWDVLLVTVLFSSCFTILRYASTLYCYMRIRKQM